MNKTKVTNIAKIPLMLGGKQLQPGESRNVEFTEGIEKRVNQGFLKVEEIRKEFVAKEKPKKIKNEVIKENGKD